MERKKFLAAQNTRERLLKEHINSIQEDVQGEGIASIKSKLVRLYDAYKKYQNDSFSADEEDEYGIDSHVQQELIICEELYGTALSVLLKKGEPDRAVVLHRHRSCQLYDYRGHACLFLMESTSQSFSHFGIVLK